MIPPRSIEAKREQMQQASSNPTLVLEEGILSNDRMLSGIRGQPSVWMEMGRVRERQKWQAFTCQLLDAAICSELEELKRKVSETLQSATSSAPLTHHVLRLIDSRKKNVAAILGKFILGPSGREAETTHEKKSSLVLIPMPFSARLCFPEDFTAPISNDSDAARDACASAAESSVEAATADPEPAVETQSRLV
jgi:hypothetical protein